MGKWGYVLLLGLINASFFILFKESLQKDVVKDKGRRRKTNARVHRSLGGVAVILDPRPIMQIKRAIFNVLAVLPPDWGIQFFHSRQNGLDFIQLSGTLSNLHSTGRLQLLEYGTQENFDYYALSEFLQNNVSFWERYASLLQSLILVSELFSSYLSYNYVQLLEFVSVSHENVLFFQADSVFCSGSSHTLTQFLDFAYIGASWRNHWLKDMRQIRGGNGGTSLRSRSAMIACIQAANTGQLSWKTEQGGEDMFFSYCVTYILPGNESHYKLDSPIRVPTMDEMDSFSAELYFNESKKSVPFGIHKWWNEGYLGATLATNSQVKSTEST